MSPRQTLFGWLSVLAASALLCVGLSAPTPGELRAAQPAEEKQEKAAAKEPSSLLPADPVLYVGWDGEEAHREAMERTAAHKALYASGLMPTIEKMFAGLIPNQNEEQAKLIEEVSKTLRANGVSFAVALPEGEDAPPLPWAIAVLHGAAGLEPRIAEAVRGAIEEGDEAVAGSIEIDEVEQAGRQVTTLRTPQFPPAELAWWTDGGHLVVAAGMGAVNRGLAVADGRSGNLAASRLWKEYRQAKGKTVASFGWFDIERALKAAGPLPVPTGDARRTVTVGQIAEALGLDGFKAIVGRSGFDGEATWSEFRSETTGDLDGVLALAEQEPITLDDLPPLPARLSGFGAGSLDPAKVFDAVLSSARGIVALGPPDAKERFERGLEQLPERTGLDVKADLLEPIGNVVCVYTDDAQVPFGLGLTAVFSVDDAAKLRSTLDRLLDAAARQTEPKNFSVRRSEKHGRQVVTLEIVGAAFNPSFVVTDEWFAISVVPQTIETFLLRLDGELPTWKAEGEFAAAMRGVPKEFTSLMVTDPRSSYRFLTGLAPIVLPIVRRAIAESRPDVEIPFDVAVADLPPAELIAEPLFPNVTFGYRDGDTFVRHSRTSLPGLFFGENTSGVAVAAVAVALLLPAVQAARTAARRTQSANNLKQLGLSLHNYHDTFNHFPRGTVVNPNAKPEERLSWIVSVLPFLEQAPLYQRFQERQKWDATPNAALAKTKLQVLVNPNLPVAEQDGPAPTHYAGLAGIGADGPTLPVSDPKAGFFAYDRTTRLRDITDGTSNTVAISEVTETTAGPWAKGGPSTIRPLTKKPYVNGPDGLGGRFAGGVNMLLGDGSVRFIPEGIDPAVMEALVTIRGGEVIDDDALDP